MSTVARPPCGFMGCHRVVSAMARHHTAAAASAAATTVGHHSDIEAARNACTAAVAANVRARTNRARRVVGHGLVTRRGMNTGLLVVSYVRYRSSRVGSYVFPRGVREHISCCLPRHRALAKAGRETTFSFIRISLRSFRAVVLLIGHFTLWSRNCRRGVNRETGHIHCGGTPPLDGAVQGKRSPSGGSGVECDVTRSKATLPGPRI